MSETEFVEELGKIGIFVKKEQMEKLDQFYELLISWNEKINLTAITEKKQVYLKHFYDSATLFHMTNLNEDLTLCDIGSGAGFPGIVLKILFPKLKITLVDSLNKRINFLQTVIENLRLEGINAVCTRGEEYAKENRESFDIVTARAVAHLPILIEICTPLVKKGGQFIAMKGNNEEEIKESTNAIKELKLKEYKKVEINLPLEAGKRMIISYKKQEKTDTKYPRKYAEIKKKPL